MTKTTTNRWVLALLLLAATTAAQAQFVGARSLFMMSSLLDNPAAAGQSPCVDMRMGARAQWVGFEGAPNTQFASLSGQLGSSTTFSHGLGGHLMLDQMGPWRTLKFGVAYASRIRLSVGGTLSGGIGLGLVQHNMSASVSQALAGDPAVLFEPTGMSQVIFPTLDLGFMYNTKSTMVGLGMHNVTSPTLNNFAPGTSTGRAVVLTGAHELKLDRRFAFMPAAQIRLASRLPSSVDVRGMFRMDNKIALGAGYRSQSAMVGLFQIQLFETMSVGYAYDFGVSSIASVAPSTHEIVISLSACDKDDPFFGNGMTCPAFY